MARRIIMYKCLKEGWITYSDGLKKHNIRVDKGRYIRSIDNENKEKIGTVWFVKEKSLLEGKR